MTNRTMQRETVVGVFNDQARAERAIEDLKAAGYSPADIGILMQNKEGAADLAASTGTKAGEGAATGATAGGLLGALGGLLVGLGALAIPGIGPVLAAGPLAAALGTVVGGTATGAILGAGVGALAGALVGLGIPEDEAKVYEDRFRQGRILVTVKSGADRYVEAQQILRNAGAEQIDFANAGARTANAQMMNQGQTRGQTQTQGQTYTQAEGSDRMRVPVVEETLNVQKGMRQAGEVEIGKRVVEEQVNVPVQLSHEEVTITRHAVDRPMDAGERTLGDGEVIRVPVSEETVKVEKQARVKEEIEINKQKVTEQRNVSDTVRREEVDVNKVGGVEERGRATDTGYSRTANMSDEDVNVETPYRPEGETDTTGRY
ncbi:MAG: DUF2382 domain-containing protein [Chloroflexia bacterium]